MSARPALGLALTAFVALVVAATAWRESARLPAARQAAAGRSSERGAALYREHCGGCHGITGGGVLGVAPALDTPAFFGARLSELGYSGSLDAYIEGTIGAGRHGASALYRATMPAFAAALGGPLRPDQVRDVTWFVLGWEDGGAPAAASPPGAAAGGAATAGASRGLDGRTAPDVASSAEPAAPSTAVATGQLAFQANGCLGCHGWPGGGGVTGPDLEGIAALGPRRSPDLTAAQFLRVAILGPSATVAPDCPTGPCPDMMPRYYGDELDQLELDTLVAYLATLHTVPARRAAPERPLRGGLVPTPSAAATAAADGEALYTAHCQGCHGAEGQGRFGTDLSAVLLGYDPVAYTAATVAEGAAGTTMPAWDERLGGPLTPEEIERLAAYVVERVR